MSIRLQYLATNSNQSIMSPAAISSNATRMYSKKWASKRSVTVYGFLSLSNSYAQKLSGTTKSGRGTRSPLWITAHRTQPTPLLPPVRHAIIQPESDLYRRRPLRRLPATDTLDNGTRPCSKVFAPKRAREGRAHRLRSPKAEMFESRTMRVGVPLMAFSLISLQVVQSSTFR